MLIKNPMMMTTIVEQAGRLFGFNGPLSSLKCYLEMILSWSIAQSNYTVYVNLQLDGMQTTKGVIRIEKW